MVVQEVVQQGAAAGLPFAGGLAGGGLVAGGARLGVVVDRVVTVWLAPGLTGEVRVRLMWMWQPR